MKFPVWISNPVIISLSHQEDTSTFKVNVGRGFSYVEYAWPKRKFTVTNSYNEIERYIREYTNRQITGQSVLFRECGRFVPHVKELADICRDNRTGWKDTRLKEWEV